MTQIAFADNGRASSHEDHEKRGGVFSSDRIEQSAAEQRSRTVHRIAALGEMTGGIAHDFRNILAVIESGLRLAERNSEEPDKVRAYIAGARDGVDRGLKLTSQLLTFAQLPELEARPGDANKLLRNLEQFLRYAAGPRVRIVLDLAPDLPMCLLDPSQFSAALLNLVVNARDAMPDGGEIHVSTERCNVETAMSGSPAPGAYVRVRIMDNGPGMPAEIAGKIFDPFFTTKGERGTGLGLPQVAAFMRLVRGHVSVTSKPGVGTTFDLLFPSAMSGGLVRSGSG